ncbi:MULTISPECIES: DUF1285 domain-containing protein [Colwellia]|uniref:DUF1285 domain-containing protein n=1 Tax=Colwellia marinimaniae TaxID=1513592 RepID=A0ABQ0MWL1_9GAMM|nr:MULTISPECIES: DUF1285 domain-containing protein [Colwellia]GAW96745.1 hypothetical protein MTCD1_02366 [Colwellia marinimaniae]
MSLDKISAQLAGSKKSLPPVESWNPPYCGEIDIQIKANGDWYYHGTIFKRLALVKLFASVLIKEVNKEVNNGVSKATAEYFLVTPVEKVKIQVDDVPFVLTQWRWLDEEKTVMQVSTNLDDEFTLDEQHPLIISENGNLYVTVRRNLKAKVHRNVYYQWVDIAKEIKSKKGTELIISSAECQFSLGSY